MPFALRAGVSCESMAIWRLQKGQCKPLYSPTSTGLSPRKSSMAILPSRVIASSTKLGAVSPNCRGRISRCSDMLIFLASQYERASKNAVTNYKLSCVHSWRTLHINDANEGEEEARAMIRTTVFLTASLLFVSPTLADDRAEA